MLPAMLLPLADGKVAHWLVGLKVEVAASVIDDGSCPG
jgi:hypothetical protein